MKKVLALVVLLAGCGGAPATVTNPPVAAVPSTPAVTAVATPAVTTPSAAASSTLPPTASPTTPPTASPTLKPTVPPTPSPTENANPLLLVGDPLLITWGDGDPFYLYQVIQEVKNVSADWIELGEGDFTIFGEDGSVTEASSLTFYFPRLVPPGGTAYALEDSIVDDKKKSDFAKAEASVRWRAAEDPGTRFEVSNVKVKQSDDGGVEFTGLVKNISTEPAESVLVGLVYFDAAGKVRGIAYDGSGVDNVDPGTRKGFSTNPTPPIRVRDVKEWKAFAESLF